MPLSILVGVLNTGKTFQFVLCFITLEITALFKFIEYKLDELFFYNYLRSSIIYGNFVKRLTLAIARHKAKHQQVGHGKTYILQICK